MLTRILFGLSLLLSFSGFSQQASDYVLQAQKLEVSRNEVGALDKYKQALLLEKNNLDALCGASLMCNRIGNRESDETKKKAFFRTAHVFAEEAIKINPKSSKANYVMAVAKGRIAMISGPKDKVAASRDIKKFADNAVRLDPNNAAAWHVLGKYNYEISNLNFAERGAAKLLFGGLPPGDNRTAIQCYEKCKSLDAAFITNLFDLSKSYLQEKQNDKARQLLNQALRVAERQQDDAARKVDCKKLLQEIK